MAVLEMDYANFQTFQSELESSSIKLDITHSDFPLRIPEYRISLQDTILEIKHSLMRKLGTQPEDMSLMLRLPNESDLLGLDNESALFSEYNPIDGYIIHVIDNNPLSITKQINDVSQVSKYVMSKEDYRKRPITVKKYFKQLKKDHPDLFSGTGMEFITNPNYMKDEADLIEVGNRCELVDGSGLRGEVMFVGQVPEIKWGWYVGVRLDIMKGKNDGSCKGVQYFNCLEGYGLFLRPDKIKIGDFGVKDLEEEDIDEI